MLSTVETRSEIAAEKRKRIDCGLAHEIARKAGDSARQGGESGARQKRARHVLFFYTFTFITGLVIEVVVDAVYDEREERSKYLERKGVRN